MENIRQPFTGVWNIIRFNWHFYVFAAGFFTVLFLGYLISDGTIQLLFGITGIVVFATVFVSLLTSFWVYDLSDLYDLTWLDLPGIKVTGSVLNVNAGFDETSILLQQKYPGISLQVCDFYDPEKHTEISVKRAREAYPPYPGTTTVRTSGLPFQDDSVDFVFAILSAHEIRQEKERVTFFRELGRILKPQGRILVTEHLRDLPNFLAYNIGFFHFHSRRSWMDAFRKAGLSIEKEIKITPFISTFILKFDGDTS